MAPKGEMEGRGASKWLQKGDVGGGGLQNGSKGDLGGFKMAPKGELWGGGLQNGSTGGFEG